MNNKQYLLMAAQQLLKDSNDRKEQLLDRLKDRFTNLLPYQRNEGRALKTLVSFSSLNNEQTTKIAKDERIVFTYDDQNYVFTICEDIEVNASELLYVYEMDKRGFVHDTLQNDNRYLLFEKQKEKTIVDQLIFSVGDIFSKLSHIDVYLYLKDEENDFVLKQMINCEEISCEWYRGDKCYPVTLSYEQGIHLSCELDLDEDVIEEQIILSIHELYPTFYIDQPYLLCKEKHFSSHLLYVNETKTEDPAVMFNVPLTQEDCFYIGFEELFFNDTETITISFLKEMSVIEKNIAHETVKYKLIMREWPMEADVYDVYAQEVIFEYFNGEKWVIIEELLCQSQLFMNDDNHYVTLVLHNILGWQPCEINDCVQHFIRIRLVRCENSYQNSVRYHVPVLRDLQICVSERSIPLTSIFRKNIQDEDISELCKQSYEMQSIKKEHSIFLGFSQGIPETLYFQFQYGGSMQTIKTSVYQNEAFKSIDMIDETNGFSQNGRIQLFDEVVCTPVALFESEQECYWLRLCFNDINKECCIDKVDSNVVEAIEQYEEQLFFTLDDMNREFVIPYENIRRMQVYVKEEEWCEWGIVNTLLDWQSSQRLILFEEATSQVKFHPYVFQFFKIALNHENVLIKLIISSQSKQLPLGTMGQLFNRNERISSLTTICHAYGFIERENDEQMKYYASQLCSTFNQIICMNDLKKWLFANYRSIHDCKLIQTKQECTLFLVFHNQSSAIDYQLLDEISASLSNISFLKALNLHVSLPICVYASFVLSVRSKAKNHTEIKEGIELLLNSILTKEIGKYPNKAECKQSIKKLYDDIDLEVFEIYLSYEYEHEHYFEKIEEAHYLEEAVVCMGENEISIVRNSL